MDLTQIDIHEDAATCPYLALVQLSNYRNIKRVTYARPIGDVRYEWHIWVIDDHNRKSEFEICMRTLKVKHLKTVRNPKPVIFDSILPEA